MPIPITQLTSDQIQVFLLIFVRIVTIIPLLPIFGSANIPSQLKAGFAFILALIVFPFVSVPQHEVLAANIFSFLFLIMKEICVGLTIGFTASFLFNAILFAGRLLDTEMGFTIVEIIDPLTDVLTTVTSQFKILVFSTLFLLLNGHYFLILAIEKSFDVIPIGDAVFRTGEISQLMTKMVNDIFILGIRFAAPVYVVLLLSSLALGIIARTVPQLNVFFVGMPIKIILGLVTLAIALPTLVIIFQDIFTIFLKDLWKLLFLMA